MVTPPGIPKIPVRTPTSPVPLSLTKQIATKELGKPTTSVSPVSRVFAASVSEVIAQDNIDLLPCPSLGLQLHQVPALAPMRANRAIPNLLNPSTQRFNPNAQGLDDAHDGAYDKENSVPPVRIKMGPLDEDKDASPSATSNAATAFPATANVATNATTSIPTTANNAAANTKTSTSRNARATIANAATSNVIAKVTAINFKTPQAPM